MITETIDRPERPLSAEQRRGKRLTFAILSYKTILWAVIVAGVITGTVLLPVKDWLIQALEWTQGLGIWAYVFVVAFYIVACVFLLPGSVLTLGAGFLFQLLGGAITVSIGSTLGACAAFWIGRTVARNWIADKVAANEKFAAIDEAVAGQGFKIVLLTRLSPIFPFNLLNYAFGLTKISFWKYALGSWIGMIPGTIMYVYFGAGLRSFADLAAGNVEKGTAGRLFFWFGLAATIAVTVVVTRIARNALKEAVQSNNAETAESQTDREV
ncbi:MAG: TVP38/TMEM64 family protein [Phycisphaerales bacterium]|nr:MAG: TVP38/TMEM64 family protein [Phycisphaerales bacterium]